MHALLTSKFLFNFNLVQILMFALFFLWRFGFSWRIKGNSLRKRVAEQHWVGESSQQVTHDAEQREIEHSWDNDLPTIKATGIYRTGFHERGCKNPELGSDRSRCAPG